jgi:hypothetical protein
MIQINFFFLVDMNFFRNNLEGCKIFLNNYTGIDIPETYFEVLAKIIVDDTFYLSFNWNKNRDPHIAFSVKQGDWGYMPRDNYNGDSFNYYTENGYKFIGKLDAVRVRKVKLDKIKNVQSW